MLSFVFQILNVPCKPIGASPIPKLVIKPAEAFRSCETGGTLRQNLGVHVAERDKARAGQLVDVIAHVAGALRIDTDDGDTDVTRRAAGCGSDLAVEAGGTGDERGAAANE